GRTVDLAQVFPAFRLIPGEPRPATERQAQRAALFGSVRELIAALARRVPVVIAIDDLQWAGSDSLAMLAEIVREPSCPGLLVVATVRTEAGTDRDRLVGSLPCRTRSLDL